MKNIKYNILNGNNTDSALPSQIQSMVEEFVQKCIPIEKNMYVFADEKTGAYYTECHMYAR